MYFNNLSCILTCVGVFLQLPIVDDEMKRATGETKDEDTSMTQMTSQKLVTADGTYASQSAFSAGGSGAKKDSGVTRPPLRQFLYNGDFFVGSSIATSLTKLALRYVTLVNNKKRQNVRTLSARALDLHFTCT